MHRVPGGQRTRRGSGSDWTLELLHPCGSRTFQFVTAGGFGRQAASLQPAGRCGRRDTRLWRCAPVRTRGAGSFARTYQADCCIKKRQKAFLAAAVISTCPCRWAGRYKRSALRVKSSFFGSARIPSSTLARSAGILPASSSKPGERDACAAIISAASGWLPTPRFARSDRARTRSRWASRRE